MLRVGSIDDPVWRTQQGRGCHSMGLVRLGGGNSEFGGGRWGVLHQPMGSSAIAFLFSSEAQFWNDCPICPFLSCFSYHHKVYEPSYFQVKLKQKLCADRTPKAPETSPSEHSDLWMKLDVIQKLTPNSQACGCRVLSSKFFSLDLLFLGCQYRHKLAQLEEVPGIPQGVGRASDLKGFKKVLYLSMCGIHFGVRYLLNLEKMHCPIYLYVISQQQCTDKLFPQNCWASVISGTESKFKMLWLHKLIGWLLIFSPQSSHF